MRLYIFTGSDRIGRYRHTIPLDMREYLAAYMSGDAAAAFFHASFIAQP